jgi:hypothetical protein
MRSSSLVEETKLADSTFFSRYLTAQGMAVAFSNFLRPCLKEGEEVSMRDEAVGREGTDLGEAGTVEDTVTLEHAERAVILEGCRRKG